MLFSKLIGMGSYLPPRRVTNHDLVNTLAAAGIETSDEWITSRSGISARHYADENIQSSDLAVEASKNAINMAGINPNDIDLIICATSTPDFLGGFPSTACIVQKKLFITNGSPAFDVQAVCSGFVYALTIANNFIKSGSHKLVLVIGAEVFSRLLNFDDRSSCVLFGDGAGAFLLSADEKPGIIATKIHADGRYSELLCVPGNIAAGSIVGSPFLYMNGSAVFKHAVSMLEKVANEVLSLADIKSSDVDWLVPHQANIRIMQSSAKKIGLPLEKMVVTVAQHGNTSAASIPLAFDCAVRDNRIKAGHTTLVECVGGGFTWGASVIRI